MDWILTVVLGVVCLGAIGNLALQTWFHHKYNKDRTESNGQILYTLNEQFMQTVQEHSKRQVEVVMEFTKRLAGIEELALIEQKERRVYLGMAEGRIKQQQQMQAEAIRKGQPVYPPGFFSESDETEPEEPPDPLTVMMAMGNRRGTPPPQAKSEVEESGEKAPAEEKRA